jgi:anti-sigma factor RsiW
MTAPRLTDDDRRKMFDDEERTRVDHWFTHHPPTTEQVASYLAVRDAGRALAHAIIDHCPASADRSAAFRKVREAVMTANASIACEGR